MFLLHRLHRFFIHNNELHGSNTEWWIEVMATIYLCPLKASERSPKLVITVVTGLHVLEHHNSLTAALIYFYFSIMSNK